MPDTDSLATRAPIETEPARPCRHDGESTTGRSQVDSPPRGAGDAERRPGGTLSPAERDALTAPGGFLARLPPPLIDAILARLRVWRLASGEPILRIGQPVEHWLGIASGSALVFMDLPHQPDLQCTNWAPAGVWVNLYNPLALAVSTVELRAEGPTAVAALQADDLALLCQRFPELSREMATANAGNLRRAMQVAMAAQRASLKQRQLFWLLEQTREPQVAGDGSTHVPLQLSQDALARWHGVSRQAWCDGMKALEAEGLVRRCGANVVVDDLAALEAATDAETLAVEAPYMSPQRPPSRPRSNAAGFAGPPAMQALRTSEFNRISRGRWFASLAPALRQRILELSQVRRLAAGEPVLEANEWPEGCWLVIDGAIRLDNPHATPPYRTMALLPPGAWHSHHDLVYDSPNVFDAVALHPTTLLWMPAEHFDALFRESLDYRLALIRLLALEQSQAARYACSFSWSIEMRVGTWLQMMHRYFNLESGAGPNIAAAFVLEDIAQWLGTTRQAVSRQLKALETQGVICRSRDRLNVLQPDRLPRLLA